jgi:hypothetical protein
MQGLLARLKHRFSKNEWLDESNANHLAIKGFLENTRIIKSLNCFQPLIAGTFPIGLEVEGSDVDLLCSYSEAATRLELQSRLQEMQPGIKYCNAQDHFTASWEWEHLPIELYASEVPSADQAAFRHLLIEAWLLETHGPELKATVLHLKQQGIKTEPAFAKALEMEGDPYTVLLDLAEKIEKNNL